MVKRNFYFMVFAFFVIAFMTLKLIGVSKSQTDRIQNRTFNSKLLYYDKKYLHIAQLANPAITDPKDFLDRPTKMPLYAVLNALDKIDENDRQQAIKFMEMHFDSPGHELESFIPIDWTPFPKFVDNIKSVELHKFSLDLNMFWTHLFMKYNSSEYESKVSSHIRLKNPFVVSGGRLREMHYWDTYWIIKGLLVCDMYDSVKLLLENFVDLIQRFSFIPNGSRVYYLNRSQPPYFSKMVWAFYEAVNNSKSLSHASKTGYLQFVMDVLVPFMIQEHVFWTKTRSKTVEMSKWRSHKLNIYSASKKEPRIDTNRRPRSNLEAIAAAESGYDYSSRWLEDPLNLTSIQTRSILPVDLNSLLYETEILIAKLCDIKGNFFLDNL